MTSSGGDVAPTEENSGDDVGSAAADSGVVKTAVEGGVGGEIREEEIEIGIVGAIRC